MRLTALLKLSSGNIWVAQCLERNVEVRGDSTGECKLSLLKTLGDLAAADLDKGREPLQALRQAPKEHFLQSVTMNALGPELPVYIPPYKGACSVPAPIISVQFLV